MIELTRGYNGDQYVSHFQCRQYLFNLVYTHRHKSDVLQLFEKAINTIENQYNGKVRYIRLDGETSLGNAFETLVIEKGIKPERTAPDTPAQNGGSERSGRVIITKTRQYDAVNAFANALLPNPITCKCAEGYDKHGFIL